MYSVSGEFGEVRHIQKSLIQTHVAVPFSLSNGGWHRCNDKYHFYRENGFANGYLFLFSLSSGGYIQFDDQSPVSLPADSVACIPPRRRHAYYTGTGELWEFYWLHVEEHPLLQFTEIFQDKPYIPFSHTKYICGQLEELIEKDRFTPTLFSIAASATISAFYHALLSESHHRYISKSDHDPLVRQIIHAMEGNCARDWTLPQLSEQYYISVPQLIRRFKAETGMTPYVYLMQIRLQTAEIYLKYTDMTINEISIRTGFPNVSNFIQQFRKYRKTTPQKYRNH